LFIEDFDLSKYQAFIEEISLNRANFADSPFSGKY